MSTALLVASLLSLSVTSTTTNAADPWIGQRVFWKDSAKAHVGDKEIDIYLLPFPATVEAVTGNWLWVGRAWLHKRDVITLGRALNYYSERIRRSPSSRAYDNRGSAWFAIGECDAAIKDHNRAIAINPSYAMAYNNRAGAWYAKGELDYAIKDFTEAIRIDPNLVRAYNNRGSVWQRKGEFDKAVTDYTEAIRIDPLYRTAYYGRAIAWHAKSDLNNAIKDYNETIRLDPKLAYAYYGRGLASAKNGELQNATKDYSAAIALDATHAMAYNQLAWLRATCPDPQFRDGNDAVLMATKACDLTDWKNWANLDTLAAACAEQGDFDNAVNWQNKAIDLVADESDKQIGRERLKLYEARKPYRDEAKK